MKSLLLLTCLIVSGSCFSQVFPAKYQVKERQFVPVKNDTVELTGNIRFIKVDGKVYEIKRNTCIEEAKPAGLFLPSLLTTPCDTTIFGRHLNTNVSQYTFRSTLD